MGDPAGGSVGEQGLVAVTGATGALGGRVAARLASRGVPQRLVVRDPARAPQLARTQVSQASYDDPDALRAAFQGARTVFLVSAAEHPERVRQHLTAVDAAVAAGVERIVYTSFVAAAADATFVLARHHWATEERIRAAGLGFTFLRDSIYLDHLPFMAGTEGVIRGPADAGRFAPVALDDIADVAVEALFDPRHDGRTYDVTGPEALTFGEIAQRLSGAAGRKVVFVDETLEEAWQSRAHYGAPDWEVEGWVTTYLAIGRGELDVRSDAVRTVTGRDAMSVDEFLRRNPQALAALRG